MHDWREELARRMAGPQRHRLWQGYPSLPLMQAAAGAASRARLRADGQRTAVGARIAERTSAGEAASEPAWLTLDATRPLIIGVLPHAQCNPKVDAVVAADLATLDADALRLTPRGMFYADSVVGLFMRPRVETLRATAAGRRTSEALRARLEFGDHMG